MRRALFCLLLALFLIGLVSAKVIDAPSKVFSVDIPEHWVFDSETQNGAAWRNANNTGALVLNSPSPIYSPDQLAQMVAKKNPKAVISDDKLGGVAAKRVEYVYTGGYKVRVWFGKKGKKTASVTLVNNASCPDKIEPIQKKLLASFKWKK